MQLGADRWRRLTGAVLVLVCVLSCAFTFRRLYFGVEFGDESWYLACTYRFLLGDRPFIDESNASQSASLITLPLLRLYAWASGGIDGAIFYMRVLYFVFSCAIAGCAWLCFRGLIGDARALLVGLLSVLFVPYGLPCLGYNTLASGFFTAGIFLGVAAAGSRRREFGLFAAGLSHGLCTIAIPTYLLPCLVFLLIWLQYRPRERRLREAVTYGCSAAIPALLLSPQLLAVNSDFLSGAHRHMESGNWTAKFRRILRVFWQVLPHKPLLGTILILLASARWRRMRTLGLLSLCALPWALMKSHHFSSSACYTNVLASCGPVLAFLLWKKERVRELFLVIWVPSAVAGVVAASTSNTGFANAAFGFFPGAVLTCVFAVMGVRELAPWPRLPVAATLSFLWPLVPALAFLDYHKYPKGEPRLSALDTRIERGAFRGIYTTAHKRDLWETLSADVESSWDPRRRVLFYPWFPAGYLTTSMRPAGGTAWSIWPFAESSREAIRAELLQSLEPHREEGVLIFEMRSDVPLLGFPEIRALPPGAYLPRESRLVLERPDYAVFHFP